MTPKHTPNSSAPPQEQAVATAGAGLSRGVGGPQGLRSPSRGGLSGLPGSHTLSEQITTKTSSHTMPTGCNSRVDRLRGSPREGEDSCSPSAPSPCATQPSLRVAALSTPKEAQEPSSPHSQTLSLPRQRSRVGGLFRDPTGLWVASSPVSGTSLPGNDKTLGPLSPRSCRPGLEACLLRRRPTRCTDGPGA